VRGAFWLFGAPNRNRTGVSALRGRGEQTPANLDLSKSLDFTDTYSDRKRRQATALPAILGRNRVDPSTEGDMSRTVEHKKLETPTARARLKRGRQPHLQSLIAGQAALAYQRKEGVPQGRWLLRRNLGGDKYAVAPLGWADDGIEADGTAILDFEQAKAKALAVLAEGGEVKSHGSDCPQGFRQLH
jgi:hypothetical protein